MKPHQLPLKLPVENAVSRDDLIVGAGNLLATEIIDAWPGWPGRVVVLSGPPGSGKSHLAQIWGRRAEARICTTGELSRLAPEVHTHLVLEDVGPAGFDERAMFHLLNHMRAQSLDCLITSRFLPAEWNIGLPDLKSRISAAQLVLLRQPDDEMLHMVMFKLFADRQLAPEAGVVGYLCARMERSMQAARLLVEEIDREALARGKRITRAIAASALKAQRME